MSISTEKATLQITFQKEKLEALRFYYERKGTDCRRRITKTY